MAGQQAMAFDLLSQSSTPLCKVGSLYVDVLGRQYRYGQYNGAHTAGRWSIISTDSTYDCTPMTTALCGTPGTNWKNIGIACRDGTDNYYGWFFVGYGEFEAIIENSFAATDILYTTANAGIPGTNSSSFVLDGVKTIDAGVTSTRVTIVASGILTAGVIMAHD